MVGMLVELTVSMKVVTKVRNSAEKKVQLMVEYLDMLKVGWTVGRRVEWKAA